MDKSAVQNFPISVKSLDTAIQSLSTRIEDLSKHGNSTTGIGKQYMTEAQEAYSELTQARRTVTGNDWSNDRTQQGQSS